VGFDAGEVGRDPDAERLLRSSYSPSMNYEVRRRQKMLRSFSGTDRMLSSFGGMDQVVRDIRGRGAALSSATRLARIVNPVGVNTASIYADLAKSIVPESMRLGLPRLSQSLASMGYYPRLQSDALRYGRIFGNLGLSSSIAQAFKMQGLASAYSAAWSLHRVPSVRMSAIQSFLKVAPTFGPIVISPDDDSAPFDYHPDLQGWFIPETSTDSEEATDVEKLVTAVFAYALGIAQHHRTRVLVTVVVPS
jgi:hypothetical protein